MTATNGRTPKTEKIARGKQNAEATLCRLHSLLLSHFNSVNDIQKTVFEITKSEENFKALRLDDMTLCVKIADEIGRHWQTVNSYQDYFKAVSLYFNEMCPAVVRGEQEIVEACADMGRLIAGVAFLDGDYYLGLHVLKTVLDLSPIDVYSYEAVLRWSCFLNEWDMFLSYFEDKRFDKFKNKISPVMDACYFYYVFHTLPMNEKFDILPDVLNLLNKLESEVKVTFINFMAQQILYSIFVTASNLEKYDINKYMDPGFALLKEEARALSLMRSRIEFYDKTEPLSLYQSVDGNLPDGSSFFRNAVNIASFCENQMKYNYYLKCFGMTREAESKLVQLYYNSLRLANPYRVLVSLSEYYSFKEKTAVADLNRIKAFAASASLLFSVFDDENERTKIVNAGFKFEAVSDSSSIVQTTAIQNEYFIKSHVDCKCCSCLLLRSHGAFSVVFFWLQYLLKPQRPYFERFQKYLKKPTTVSNSRQAILKFYAPKKLKEEHTPFHVSYYFCVSTLKFIEENKFKSEDNYEKFCDLIIQQSAEWLDLKFYYLLARQLKRSSAPPKLDYFWLKFDGQLEDVIQMFGEMSIKKKSVSDEVFRPFEEYFQNSITMINNYDDCKRAVPGSRNPFTSNIEAVLKARTDFRANSHLFYGEWRTRICEYLGAHFSECYPWYSAWYFIESRASSLRQSVRSHRLNSSNMRFNDVDVFKDFVHTIPEDITVLQLVLDERNILWLIRLDSDARPLVIPLKKIDLKTDKCAKMLTRLMILNDSTMEVNDIEAKVFWDKRRKLNAKLKELLDEFEDNWIGKFRPLFIPTGRFNDDIIQHLNSICSVLVEHGFFKDDAKLLARMTLHSEKDDYAYLLKVFGSLQINKHKICDPDYQSRILMDMEKYLVPEEILEKYNETDKYTLLMLSPSLHVFPWEFFRLYVQKAPYILRMHSLHFLQRAMESYGFPHIVDGKNTYYVLNPGNDLPHTEQRISQALNLTSLQGMTRSAPNKEEITKLLSTKDIFLYIGHGSGFRHIGISTVRDTKCRAAAILMGCSSVRLVYEGYGFDGHSPCFPYSIAGSPCVIGNLWMVTDGEIDKFFIAFMQHCFQELVKVNQQCSNAATVRVLMKALVKARQSCRLKYLTGAAVVAYGLPLESR